MAAAITIEATLNEKKIDEGFERVGKTAKRHVDAMTQYAIDAARRFQQAVGGAQGLERLAQVRERFIQADAAREAQHQRRLVEINQRGLQQRQAAEALSQGAITALRERAAQQATVIEQRRAAQIEVIRQREAATATRHEQRLTEIREAAATRAKSIADGFGSAFGRAATTILGVTGAIGAVKKAIDESVNLDSAKRALTAVSGSAEGATAQLSRLREIAKLPGIDFAGAIQGATRLQAVGFGAAEAERALRAFANAVATTGGGAEQLQSITIQLAQLSSKSKVLSQDLRPIIEAAPAVGQALKRAFGTVDSEQISKQLEKLGVDSKGFINILLTELEKLPKVSAGAKESIDNFAQAVNQAFAKVGDSILTKLTPALDTLGPKIENAATAFANLSGTEKALLAYFAALPLLIGPVTKAVTALTAAVGTVSQAGSLAAALAGINPVTALVVVGLAGIGIAALTAAQQTELAMDRIKNAFDRAGGREIRDLQGNVVVSRVDPNNPLFAPRPGERPRLALDRPVDPLNPLGANFTTDAALIAERLKSRNIPTLPPVRPSSVIGGGGRGRRASGDAIAQEQLDAARDAIELAKAARPHLAALTEELNKVTNQYLALGGVITEQVTELPMERRIAFLEAQIALAEARAKRLRQEVLGIPDLPKVQEFKGRLPIPEGFRPGEFTPEGFRPGEIPGGPIPTPKILEDLKRLNEIAPPVPRLIAEEFDNAARFAKGFNAEIETMGSIFERFGASVSRSLLSVKGLFSGIAQAFKNLFLDLVGGGLQRIVGGVLGLNTPGGGGGVFGSFRTPSFNPNASGGGLLGSIRNFLSGGFSGGARAPVSASTLPILPNIPIPGLSDRFGNPGTGTGDIVRAAGGGISGGLFGGIGFGKAVGSGGALASLLPFLGVSLGSGLGGPSTLGRILGGVGGGLVGVGLTAAPAALAGHGLLAGLFSNPFTAIAGAAALAGAFFLGRAKQRRRDEATSGDSLQNAINAIFALKSAAQASELTSVRDAESAFKTIRDQFVQETLQLKTKSVRESRLANQADITPPLHKDSIRLLFEREVLPEVLKAKQRAQTFANLIPEFATGGIFTATGGLQRGAGFALLHDREMILNLTQQRKVQSIAGPDVFQRAGVPAAPSSGPFQSGGVFASGPHADGRPLEITLYVNLGLSESGAEEIVVSGIETTNGRKVLVNTIKDARRSYEL